jgi:hypothetical protein
LLGIGGRFERRRVSFLGAHEFWHRRAAVGDPAARQRKCGSHYQRPINND